MPGGLSADEATRATIAHPCASARPWWVKNISRPHELTHVFLPNEVTHVSLEFQHDCKWFFGFLSLSTWWEKDVGMKRILKGSLNHWKSQLGRLEISYPMKFNIEESDTELLEKDMCVILCWFFVGRLMEVAFFDFWKCGVELVFRSGYRRRDSKTMRGAGWVQGKDWFEYLGVPSRSWRV